MPHGLVAPDWSWLIVLYFFIGGIAAGAYFSAALMELVGEPQDLAAVRVAHLIAFPLAAICGLLLIADLGRSERFWHMIVQSETGFPMLKWWSPMSFGSWVLLVFSGMAFLSFIDALVERGRGRAFLHRGTFGKLWALAGSLVGLLFASYTGVLLSNSNFPVWMNSTWIGALFMASAASTGLATVALFLRLRQRYPLGTRHKLEEADSYAMLLELVLIVVFVISLGAFAFPFLTDPLGAILLWGGVVVLGLLVPLGLHFLWPRALGSVGAVLAPILTLAGGLILRLVVVVMPQGVFG
jgi:formate-dependent nitrite reductase membrane component NrfD